MTDVQTTLATIDAAIEECAQPTRAETAAKWVQHHLGIPLTDWQVNFLTRVYAPPQPGACRCLGFSHRNDCPQWVLPL